MEGEPSGCEWCVSSLTHFISGPESTRITVLTVPRGHHSFSTLETSNFTFLVTGQGDRERDRTSERYRDLQGRDRELWKYEELETRERSRGLSEERLQEREGKNE